MKQKLLLISFVMLNLNLSGQTVEDLNKQALDLNKNGETKKAIIIIKKSLKKDPLNKVTYFTYGSILFLNKDLKAAEIKLQKAIQLDSAFVKAYDILVVIAANQNEPKKGIEYYNKSINIEPTMIRFLGRALLKGMTGDFKGSIIDCDEVIKINPDYPEAYFTRGNAKYGLKDIDGACADFKKAIELGKPKDAFFIKHC